MSKYYNEQNDNVSEIDVPQYGKILLNHGKNIVSFVHPTYQKHEVLCQNIEDVIKWIGYHVREERQNNKELDIGKFFHGKKKTLKLFFMNYFRVQMMKAPKLYYIYWKLQKSVIFLCHIIYFCDI